MLVHMEGCGGGGVIRREELAGIGRRCQQLFLSIARSHWRVHEPQTRAIPACWLVRAVGGREGWTTVAWCGSGVEGLALLGENC